MQPAHGGVGGWSWGVGIASYAALYLALLPTRLVVFNDDFGYIESVIQTLGAGRPVTDDFLAPYAAFFSLVCASAYGLTENFYLSTYGVVFVSSLLNYTLLFALLRDRLTPAGSAVFSLALVTLPIYLGKSLEFSATITYLGCFLGALLLHRRGSRWFYLAVLLAFANRQPGIFLLGLPAWGVLERLVRERRVDWQRVAAIAVTGGACAVVAAGMNPTFARSLAGANVVRFFDLGDFALDLELGLLMAVAFASTASFVVDPSAAFRYRRLPRHWIAPVVLSLLCLHVQLEREPVRMVETWIAASPWLTRNFQGVLLSWCLVSVWLMDYRRIRAEASLFVVALWTLYVSAQEVAWDYYWTEIAVLCLLWALGRGAIPRRLTAGSGVLLSLTLGMNLHHAWEYKQHLDEVELKIAVYEPLLREGRVSVSELSDAPFGYLGWKLFDALAAREQGPAPADPEVSTAALLASFEKFVEPRRVQLLIDRSPVPALLFRSYGVNVENLETLAEGRATIGFREAAWRAARGLRVREPEYELGDVELERYPLDNEEWRDYIEGRKASTSSLQ